MVDAAGVCSCVRPPLPPSWKYVILHHSWPQKKGKRRGDGGLGVTRSCDVQWSVWVPLMRLVEAGYYALWWEVLTQMMIQL